MVLAAALCCNTTIKCKRLSSICYCNRTKKLILVLFISKRSLKISMLRRNTKFLLVIFIIITNILFLNIILNPFGYAQSPSVAGQKKQITLTLLLNDLGQPGRWGLLFEPALQELKAKHRDIDIRIKYIEFPY